MLLLNALASIGDTLSVSALGSAAPSLPANSLSNCIDTHPECLHWAERGECKKNPGFMNSGCRAACFACQSEGCHDAHADTSECSRWAPLGSNRWRDSQRVLQLTPVVHTRDGRWAENGECVRNEAFMLGQCAFACKTCFANHTAACRRNADDHPPAAVAGTIDATFEALVAGPACAGSQPAGLLLQL